MCGLVVRAFSVLAILGLAALSVSANPITVSAPAAQPIRDDRAIQEVQRLRDAALAIASATETKTKISALGHTLRSQFDAVAIAKSVLGPFWTSASDDERSDVAQLFSDILVQAAVTQFAKYEALPFTFKEVLHIGNGDVVVVSLFTLADGRTAVVDWRLRPGAKGLSIVDISIDAKSMVVKYREEAANKISSGQNSVRDFIVSLRERLPAVPY
jgi:phospholipid transport system substrate-binding protein